MKSTLFPTRLKSVLKARQQDVMPRGVPASYLGVWQRILLETPHSRDTDSLVLWLQTPHWHADLRIPAGRPDFYGIGSIAQCSDSQLAWLATQQGFCSVTQVDGEQCTWHHQLDLQPTHGRRDIGHMFFDGESIVETGVESDYVEVWMRLQCSRGGSAALELVMENGEPPRSPAWLLVAGDCFMYVRGRNKQADTPASPLAQRLEWLDVEISFGQRYGPVAWQIRHSTLPFREGLYFSQPHAIRRIGHQLAVEEENRRRWLILDWDFGTTI